MALPMFDPTKPEVRRIFDQMVRDPWFPVSDIPKHYQQPDDRLPDPPLAIEAGGEKMLPEVKVTEGGKELPLTGQLMLPTQRQPLALTSSAAKEN